MLEPSAQPLAPDDPQLGLVGTVVWGFRRLAIHLWLSPRRLVRKLLVVVGDHLRNQMVHAHSAEHREVTEALLIERLDKPLHERDGDRQAVPRLPHLHREYQIVYGKADLLKVGGQVTGGTAC